MPRNAHAPSNATRREHWSRLSASDAADMVNTVSSVEASADFAISSLLLAGRWLTSENRIRQLTLSGQSSLPTNLFSRSATMSEHKSARDLSWPARALVGGSTGCIVGVLYLLPDFTVEGLIASMLAGAVFYSIIGVFGALLSDKPVLIVLLCMTAGGIAGRAWAEISATDWPAPVIWGAILGLIMSLVEAREAFSAEDDSGS